MTTDILFKELSNKVMGMAFHIHSKLGSGLLYQASKHTLLSVFITSECKKVHVYRNRKMLL